MFLVFSGEGSFVKQVAMGFPWLKGLGGLPPPDNLRSKQNIRRPRPKHSKEIRVFMMSAAGPKDETAAPQKSRRAERLGVGSGNLAKIQWKNCFWVKYP